MKYKVLTIIMLLLTSMVGMMTSCSREKSVKSDLFDAVPDNSSLVLCTSSADSLSSLIQSDNAILSMFYFPKSELGALLACTVDSLKRSGMFGSHLAQEAVVAIRKDGNSGLCQLYVCKTDMLDKNSVSSLVDTLKHVSSVESRIFNDIEILKLKSSDLGGSVSMTFVEGLAIFSSSSKYLEDALQCVSGNGKRLKDDASFAKAMAATGKNELANVLLSVRSFVDIFSSELFADNDMVADLRLIDSWFAFDIVNGKPLSMNGFEFPKSDSSCFAALVKSQPDIEFGLLSMIPEKSSVYMLMSFADAQKYDEALSSFMASSDKLDDRNRKVAEMNEAFGFDAKSKFYSMVKREFAYIASENGENQEEGAYVVCGLQSQSAAELELRNMVTEAKESSLEGCQDIKVFAMPYDDIPAALFGELFSNCRGNYVCCYNNFMVFANSIDDIRSLVREVSLNNTMKASISHREFLSRFSTSSSIFIYYSFACGSEIMKRFFSRQYSADIDARRSDIGSNGVLGVQLKRVDDLVYCNVSFGESDGKLSAGSEVIWETNIGESIATKPYIVRNHDTGEKEIMVQDKNNMLYLLDASGKEIWHILIDSRITSQIVQVDAYRNGKLQYIFSTKDRIYMVDRLGNFVTKYPLTLRGEAVEPIAVFDYDGNRNYRVFVACADKNVYVYDVTGNLIKGWEFAGTENIVNSEILHYVVSGEDFIVFHDNYKAYFIARNGSSKLEFLTGFKFSNNNIYCDISGSTKFVTTDENGIIRRFYKDKRQDSIALGDFSKEHYFAMKDIDADGRPDYVFADSSRLSVFGNSGKPMFEHDFSANISSTSFYQFGSQTKIGVTTTDKKLYLLNINGTLHENFPLDGETPFSVFETDEGASYSLIVGLNHGRLTNYRITK